MVIILMFFAVYHAEVRNIYYVTLLGTDPFRHPRVAEALAEAPGGQALRQGDSMVFT
jgi:hypothetical protein